MEENVRSCREISIRSDESISGARAQAFGVFLNGLWREAVPTSRGSIQLLHLRASLPLRCWRIKP